jgi:hypothetical protein
VTLAVTMNTTSGGVFRRQNVPVFRRHQLPSTRSRWDIRWVIGRRTKPTFCVFPVFSVAIKEKSCDACGDEEYYFSSCFPASEGTGVSEASVAVDRKSIKKYGGCAVVERNRLSVHFLSLAWRLWKSVVTLAVTGDTISGGVFWRRRVPVFQRHRLPLTGSRWKMRWLIGRRTKPTFCAIRV